MNNRPDFPRITNEWMLFILHIFSFLKEGWGDMWAAIATIGTRVPVSVYMLAATGGAALWWAVR